MAIAALSMEPPEHVHAAKTDGVGHAVVHRHVDPSWPGSSSSIGQGDHHHVSVWLNSVFTNVSKHSLTRPAFPADVARVAEIQALVRDVLARMGQIDILVNVAGVNRRVPSTEITEEDWDTVLDLNLKGLFFTSQAVGRYWIETRRFAPEHDRGKGKIINIGSIAGDRGRGRVAPYAASKSGVLGVTRSLAVEWATDGICVNCLAPGYIETKFTKPLFDDPTFTTSFHNRVPMGRRGYPVDLVGAAVFLAAPASDYLTGQTIVVDGGFLIA